MKPRPLTAFRSGTPSHLHTGSLKLSQWDLQVIGHLYKTFHPLLLSVASWPALGRRLVVPNFFKWRIVKAALLWETFSSGKMFSSSPELCLPTELCPHIRSSHSFFFSSLKCMVGFRNMASAWVGTLDNDFVNNRITVYTSAFLCCGVSHTSSALLGEESDGYTGTRGFFKCPGRRT